MVNIPVRGERLTGGMREAAGSNVVGSGEKMVIMERCRILHDGSVH